MGGGLSRSTGRRKAGPATKICKCPRDGGWEGRTVPWNCLLQGWGWEWEMRTGVQEGDWGSPTWFPGRLASRLPGRECLQVLAVETKGSNVLLAFCFVLFYSGWPRTQSSTPPTIFFLVGCGGTFLKSHHSWSWGREILSVRPDWAVEHNPVFVYVQTKCGFHGFQEDAGRREDNVMEGGCHQCVSCVWEDPGKW